jgi:hypothetical protein
VESQVRRLLVVVGLVAHLYVPAEVLIVAPAFLQVTPFEILVAA